MQFELINNCIDETGEYWYSEHKNDKGFYQAGYFDFGCYAVVKKFKTQTNAIKWLEKMRLNDVAE
jgi:hypothetical protein